MNRFVPGALIKIESSRLDQLWFLPAKGNVVETMVNLRGKVVRCELTEAIPLRNTVISEIVLLIDENLECEVYMGLSASLQTDPILHLGRAKVA